MIWYRSRLTVFQISLSVFPSVQDPKAQNLAVELRKLLDRFSCWIRLGWSYQLLNLPLKAAMSHAQRTIMSLQQGRAHQRLVTLCRTKFVPDALLYYSRGARQFCSSQISLPFVSTVVQCHCVRTEISCLLSESSECFPVWKWVAQTREPEDIFCCLGVRWHLTYFPNIVQRRISDLINLRSSILLQVKHLICIWVEGWNDGLLQKMQLVAQLFLLQSISLFHTGDLGINQQTSKF